MSSSTRGRLLGLLRTLATYDFLPGFSLRVRRALYNPLGVLGLSAVAALVCGLFLHTQGLVLCGGMVAVILLGIAWPWLSLRGIQGSILFDRRRCGEDESARVCLTLRNRLPWPAWGLAVRDGFDRHLEPRGALSPVASIASSPGWRTTRSRWSLVPRCRGIYPVAVPRLTSGFPFGLWESSRPLQTDAPLVVWPRTFPVGPIPLVDGDQVEGNVSRNKVGSNGDVLGVRPYRRGDSPRRIHWAQTARDDRLIVCELQANARPLVQLVLDADPRIHVGDGPDGSREWAIRIVASLAKGWLEAGAQVGAVWNRQVIAAASGPRQLNALLDGLAALPDDAEATLSDTLAHPACRGFREGAQLVVTTDLALSQREFIAVDQRLWVVLRAEAFGQSPAKTPPQLPVRPWLLVESPDAVPALLRETWKEAIRGF